MARRAVTLHGCAPASLCPPFFLLRGYPRERISYGSGAPPLLRRLRPFFLQRGYPGSAKLVLGRVPSVLSSLTVFVN